MRKASLFIALAVLVTMAITATGDRRSIVLSKKPSAGGGGGGDACSSCTNETFEGAGYSVAGWTEGGGSGFVVNENYTLSPYAPINGSHSLYIQNPASDAAYTYLNMPRGPELWMRFKCVFSNAVPTGLRIAFARNSNFVFQAGVEINSTSNVVIKAGTATATTTDRVEANKTNYFWFHYKYVAGANNDEADVGFAVHPDKARPTSGNKFASLTTGTANDWQTQNGLASDDFTFSDGDIGRIVFDDLSMTTNAVIGDFP